MLLQLSVGVWCLLAVFVHRKACRQRESHGGAFPTGHGNHYVWWEGPVISLIASETIKQYLQIDINSTALPACNIFMFQFSGMGCFWGAEKLFWRLPGVFSTQVGFAGGFTPNPNYHEVCTGAALYPNLCFYTVCSSYITQQTPPSPHVVLWEGRSQGSREQSWFTNRKRCRESLSLVQISHPLPFICSQLLRMQCSRWDKTPTPLMTYLLVLGSAVLQCFFFFSFYEEVTACEVNGLHSQTWS